MRFGIGGRETRFWFFPRVRASLCALHAPAARKDVTVECHKVNWSSRLALLKRGIEKGSWVTVLLLLIAVIVITS